ncbi:Niemann-Pick C2 protein [Clonorchis sinensis]|uniref:Niemann-Pick C2 protein n=1 Tax=Clonorchis sinensis TaxID=79923 RepID=H2KT29_CLOSI|nr:Niemann-Pick C2 protein [Clonorchis sinensis]
MPLSVVLIYSVVFCVPCLTYNVSYTDCGSTGIFVVSVDIEPCSHEPCTLIKGRSASVRIKFMAFETIHAGRTNVQGLYPGSIRVPLQRNGVCAQLVPSCPIVAGEVYTYFFTGMVPNSLREGPMTIRWELLKKIGVPFLCIEFPVEVAVAAK